TTPGRRTSPRRGRGPALRRSRGTWLSNVPQAPREESRKLIRVRARGRERLKEVRESMAQIVLGDIAHGRSGDKGNHANVAVIAYTPAGFAWLRHHLTADALRDYFAPLGPSKVVRYEAPNLFALNFVLHDVLAGGASRSLRADNQGKTLALALLRMRVDRPADCDAMLRPTSNAPC